MPERNAEQESAVPIDGHLQAKPGNPQLPNADISDEDVSGLIDFNAIQEIMNYFHKVTGYNGYILDLKGNILVVIGGQDICTQFHRLHPEAQKNCIESDLYLTRDIEEGKFSIYKCRNNMWDMATPIVIGGGHIATLYSGQFFFDDEIPDERVFREQAALYGFDVDEYLAALGRVPRWDRDKVQNLMQYYVHLAKMIARLSYTNVGLTRAVAKQKLTEDELRKAKEELETRVVERTAELRTTLTELERSNKELEMFAYVASHDLQEPLRLVSAYTQMMMERYRDRLPAEADPIVGFILDGVTRMQRLIQDLLVLSRVSMHGKPFAPTDCEEVLAQTIINLRVTMEEQNALVMHDPLPILMADAGQLAQLFQNLIGNAIKFRGEAPPQIYIGARKTDDGASWLFSVRDNGIGIDREHFERIFVVFQRLHGRKHYPGSGIGLAICKKIVERHGGRIWVESERGKNSTFYFTIPISNHNEIDRRTP